VVASRGASSTLCGTWSGRARSPTTPRRRCAASWARGRGAASRPGGSGSSSPAAKSLPVRSEGARGERELLLFLPEEEPARARTARAAAGALARWAGRTARSVLGWGNEGVALAESPLAPFLAEAGFVRSGPGFRLAATMAVARPPRAGGVDLP